VKYIEFKMHGATIKGVKDVKLGKRERKNE